MLGDRAEQTTTSTGVGAIALDGTVTGRRTLLAAIGNGRLCYYAIDDGAGNWEIGIGQVNAGAPDTLQRQTVFDSSNGTAFVDFAPGLKTVRVVVPAEAFGPLGSRMCYATTTGTGSAYVANLHPAPRGLIEPAFFWLKFHTANIGEPTLNLNGFGPKPIRKGNGTVPLINNDIGIGQAVPLFYNETLDVFQGIGIPPTIVIPPPPDPALGKILRITNVPASGSWVMQADVESVVVYVLGGGGAGGGGNSGGGAVGGGGGGGGGCAIKFINAADLNATETVTIGTGGSGVTGGQGTSGGTASFGVHCSATGGEGGFSNTRGGNGGVGVGGDINLKGHTGGSGQYSPSSGAGASGEGGSGASPYGGGGGTATPINVNSAGSHAADNTGGGGGGGARISSGQTAGGNGGSGRVIIFEYGSD